ncbi:hypothetical protein DERF_006903 [Dermatophagoides farinae]|uniref:Uncharacterized protein n=1 Tax=Dermatophagoides farinae TaxID=6954 RepID=A0A922HZB5_DERFA|nr:hypothetical protein DERF_006903 [Dermatophagoides farinae]
MEILFTIVRQKVAVNRTIKRINDNINCNSITIECTYDFSNGDGLRMCEQMNLSFNCFGSYEPLTGTQIWKQLSIISS